MLIIITSIISVLVVTYFFRHKHREIKLNNTHCLITGGSSGIGLALAIQVARLGGNVTIVARSKERLASAKESIVSEIKDQNQKVLTFSSDVSDGENALKNIVTEAEEAAGPINMLVNCAGTSICYPILETPYEDFSKMMEVNYLGSAYMTRAVLPSMMKQKGGIIVYVSSLAGLMGLYGYSAYSASKFALLGFAESLQMEVKPYNISITIAFPPDTDTPGFAEEIKNKPVETMKISETAKLFSAEEVASTLLKDAVDKKFMSTVGFDGKILAILCCGMTPVRSFFDLIFEVFTMGVMRLASCFLLFQFDRIIKKCANEKKLKEKN